jgi:hypothetical protein
MPTLETERSWTTERDELIRAYRLYDRNVDIVSAFEALFTKQQRMREFVVHFERFPSCVHEDGNRATPDFCVLFKDGTGLAVEIANISLQETSVDKLCKQLLRYSGLPNLPNAAGDPVDVSKIDVLCLTPSETGNNPVDRILGERYLNAAHFYDPLLPPVIGQFSREADKYSFWRSRDPRNGVLCTPLLNDFIDGGYRAPGSFWTPFKAKYPFMNDSPPALYLACIIWLKVLPTMQVSIGEFETTIDDVTSTLKTLYDGGSKKSVREAFSLLKRANFVSSADESGAYVIKRIRSRGGEDDFAQLLAERACLPPGRTSRSKPSLRTRPTSTARPGAGQYSLFSAAEE